MDIFRAKSGFLFLLDAILIPLVMLNRDLWTSATFMLFFIIIQITHLIIFLAKDESDYYAWHAFAAILAGSLYLLIVLMSGRSLGLEILGFFLFIAYILSAIIFLAPPRRVVEHEEEMERTSDLVDSGFADDEMSEFRSKDELDEMLRRAPDSKPAAQSRLTDYEEYPQFRRQDFVESEEDYPVMGDVIDDNRGYYEIKPAPVDIDEVKYTSGDFLELYPVREAKQKKPELTAKEEKAAIAQVKIVELKETPQLDMDKLKSNVKTLDKGVQSLNEKIRLIAEKAILEGAQKKLEKMTKASKKSASKKNKADLWVYASITGNKYHSKKNCMSMKRVSKKDIVLYESAKDAKKKGLAACGLCRK